VLKVVAESLKMPPETVNTPVPQGAKEYPELIQLRDTNEVLAADLICASQCRIKMGFFQPNSCGLIVLEVGCPSPNPVFTYQDKSPQSLTQPWNPPGSRQDIHLPLMKKSPQKEFQLSLQCTREQHS